MSDKNSRVGGKKHRGTHTTLTPLAALAYDIAYRCDVVIGVSPGRLKAGLRPVSGKRRIKLSRRSSVMILMSVRDNVSHQEVRVWTRNLESTIDTIATKLRKKKITVAISTE